MLETVRAGLVVAPVLGISAGVARRRIEKRMTRLAACLSAASIWLALDWPVRPLVAWLKRSTAAHVLGRVNGLAPEVGANRLFQSLVPDLLVLLPRTSMRIGKARKMRKTA
jgi:hypothetical protein